MRCSAAAAAGQRHQCCGLVGEWRSVACRSEMMALLVLDRGGEIWLLRRVIGLLYLR